MPVELGHFAISMLKFSKAVGQIRLNILNPLPFGRHTVM